VQRETLNRLADGVWQLRNWEGKSYSYVDPAER
jgi:hypothetical protein